MKNIHHWSLPLVIYSALFMSSCCPPPRHLCHWSLGSLNFLHSALDSSSTTTPTLTSLVLSLSQIYLSTQERVSFLLIFPILACSSSCSGENFLHLQTSLLNLATQQATSWAFYWASPSSLHTKTAALHVYTRCLAWMYP